LRELLTRVLVRLVVQYCIYQSHMASRKNWGEGDKSKL